LEDNAEALSLTLALAEKDQPTRWWQPWPSDRGYDFARAPPEPGAGNDGPGPRACCSDGESSRGRRTVANMRAWTGNRVQHNNSTPPLPDGKKVGSAAAITAPAYRGGNKPRPARGLEMDVETTRNPTLDVAGLLM
jgi:hypothetical protein